MAEITLLSLSYGADSFATVLLQSARMVCSMVVFSGLAARYKSRDGEKMTKPVPMKSMGIGPEAGKSLARRQWALLLLLSAAAVRMTEGLHIPASRILIPMFLVGGV